MVVKIYIKVVQNKLVFMLSMPQPLTSSLLTCECGHELDVFGLHLIYRPFGGQQIATHDTI
jgi:hypothetical protein